MARWWEYEPEKKYPWVASEPEQLPARVGLGVVATFLGLLSVPFMLVGIFWHGLGWWPLLIGGSCAVIAWLCWLPDSIPKKPR